MIDSKLHLKNLGDNEKEIYKSITSGLPSCVFGLDLASRCHIASSLDKPILYIVKSSVDADKIVRQIKGLTGEKVVFFNAKYDVCLYKQIGTREDVYARLNALFDIKKGAKFVVTTFESLMQLFPIKLHSIVLNKGAEYPFNLLIDRLIGLGYKRDEFAYEKGTFAIRGDIFEIFPINSTRVFRCDFFGDEIETIQSYDVDERQEKLHESSVEILMCNDFYIEDKDIQNIINDLENSYKKYGTKIVATEAKEICKVLKEKLKTDKYHPSLSFIAPLLKGQTNDIFAYMGLDTIVVYDEPKFLNQALTALIKEHSERCLSLMRGGRAFDFTFNQLTDSAKIISNLASRSNLAFASINCSVAFFNPLKIFNVKSTPITKYAYDQKSLIVDVKNWVYNNYKVILFVGDKNRADSMMAKLAENFISASLYNGLENAKTQVIVSLKTLPNGFIYHDSKIVVIGTDELYLQTSEKGKIKRKRNQLFDPPEVGDFAVHETHGLGYVVEVKRIETLDSIKDYVGVQYKGGDMLYVSVEQLEKLTKYEGSDKIPGLSKIGGKDFEKVKERVRASIAEMKINLKELYDKRANQKGFAFSKDTELSTEFENAFEFSETEDQLQSVLEIKADMESNKVMDRLLCGDVGYGKTEVAFRAIFKCIMDSKQVALVCPTTILSSQHYTNAIKRFGYFGIRIAVLNRFKTANEQAGILAKLSRGEIDLIIGTHALFNKSVKFKDLGLLVLDEEHRFGVEHKEKLKELKNDVDTLTMTATPIPRTLHMSLSGIRDISTINTPPKMRIPVQTYVLEESEAVMRDAIMREISREGQAFVLYNRVDTIHSFANKIMEIIPESKVIVAHGQMDKRQLEGNVMAFYKQEFNVLIATTIIENGIDMPKANTLIVIDADKLGLSTLYQLKGRVGRSNILAHAYFMYNRNTILSETALKRLTALTEYTEMGSGYKIAMRDLEIRGAGNVLGKQQHGHMDRVGYELYSKLLKEELGEVTSDFETEINIDIDAYIPDKYINHSSSRMEVYKQIAEISDSVDENRIRLSLDENYGKIPNSVENLITISRVKQLCKLTKILKVQVNKNSAFVEFYNLESIGKNNYLNKVKEPMNQLTLSFKDSAIVYFNIKGKTNEQLAKEVLSFLAVN